MISDADRPLPTGTGQRNRCHRLALLLLVSALFLAGCRTPSVQPDQSPFVFESDTFAFANQLVWNYHLDPETGDFTHSRRIPEPDYTLHCFVMARSAAQFHYHARFAPEEPRGGEELYRTLVRRIVNTSLRRSVPPEEKVIIPGYRGLREFSIDHERLLKEECGGAWQSYCQRGHWRMIFPFTRAHQKRMADQLAAEVASKRVAVVHAVRFPSLTINHALLVIGADEKNGEMQFLAYDPNGPEEPIRVRFDRELGRFIGPRNGYFKGGRVNIYQIYHSWNY